MNRLILFAVVVGAMTGRTSHSLAQAPASTKPKAEVQSAESKSETIDFERARKLMGRRNRKETLTDEETQYLKKAEEAFEARRLAQSKVLIRNQDHVGFKPLTEMTATDRYKGEDGGLYGDGKNAPPEAHRHAAESALSQIQPLNAEGQPDAGGTIAFVSLSMSNATREFSWFKKLADADEAKSKKVTIVDCAQGGQAMAEWVRPESVAWQETDRRLKTAKISPRQVQVVWIKLANKTPEGDLEEHGKRLKKDTTGVINSAKLRFPNLRVAYLSSRIYGGYATANLNPEPYAYESAFVVRWLIQDQIKGEPALNYSPDQGKVKSPVLLWGPYLWADGITPRKSDKLIYKREDLANDGTHPSESGRDKVAKLILDFYKNDPLAKSWFLGTDPKAKAQRN